MKSVKPGRGPSAMSAIGSVVVVVFGIIWTVFAASMGAPGIFPLFGVLFVILGIVQTVYHYKNATGRNRFSSFDITDGDEEKDPLQERLFPDDPSGRPEGSVSSGSGHFCPYCGENVAGDFDFCPKCGRKLP